MNVLAVMQWASVTAESVQDRRAVDEARAAVAELIEACEARDAAGRRPSWSDIAVDCSGQLEEQARAYDAAQARYFSALANCKGTTA